MRLPARPGQHLYLSGLIRQAASGPAFPGKRLRRAQPQKRGLVTPGLGPGEDLMSPTIARTKYTLRPIAFALAALLASSLPVVCQQPEQPPAEEPAATAPQETPAPPVESEAPAAQQSPAARPVDEQPPATQPQPEVQRPPSGQQPQGQPPGAGQPPPAAQAPGGPPSGPRSRRCRRGRRWRRSISPSPSTLTACSTMRPGSRPSQPPTSSSASRGPSSRPPRHRGPRRLYEQHPVRRHPRHVLRSGGGRGRRDAARRRAVPRRLGDRLLDTFNDNRNAYFFETNPNGARTDALVTEEGRDFNVQWDAVWDVVARRNSEGWAAEMAIPFSTLRFDPRYRHLGLQRPAPDPPQERGGLLGARCPSRPTCSASPWPAT